MSNHSAPFLTPTWVKNAVFYQIFPERFANGDVQNPFKRALPWGTKPTISNYMGGDLQGIINHLDYLTDLGITALYLNPIFLAASNHKYNTTDYFQIDPQYGRLETFQELVKQAHKRDIRLILDGVFNHVGRGFFAFTDLLENQAESPYLNWFHPTALPLNAYDETQPANYASWWNIRSLPKLNVAHPPVEQYILNVARYWLEKGIDGWRLDVPNEISDHEFWRKFRALVKAVNPEAYLVGEIWQDASPWLDGTQFDAVMNYLFCDLCRDFFAHETLPVSAFAEGIEKLLKLYPWEATLAQLNLLGSHDIARFRTAAGGEISKFYAPILFQMTFPGAPCIYYGDEIGLEGAKDPDCRRCFPWDGTDWNHDLRNWVQSCIRLRHKHPALRTGSFQTLLTRKPSQIYAFARWNSQESLFVILNPSAESVFFDLPLTDVPYQQQIVQNLFNSKTYKIVDNQIKDIFLPKRSGMVLA